MVQNNILDFRFKYPKNITKFRDPDFIEAPKGNVEWTKKVNQILEKNGIPSKDVSINVRGRWIPPKFVKLSQFERSFRVDMTAEILGFDLSNLGRLRAAIDGKLGIIGC